MEIKKKEFAGDLHALRSLLLKPWFCTLLLSFAQVIPTLRKEKVCCQLMAHSFPSHAGRCKGVHVFLAGLLTINIYLEYVCEKQTQNWFGASHHTNLWWGVRETLRLCETCLTGLIPSLRFTDDNRLRRLFFFCQLYANTLIKLTSSSYSEILQPLGEEMFEHVPLQALLCDISSHAGDANSTQISGTLLWALLN